MLAPSRSPLAPLLLVLAACSSSGDPEVESLAPTDPSIPAADGGVVPDDPKTTTPVTEDGGAPPLVPARRFAPAAASWAMPSDALAGTSFMYARGTTWDVIDIDGDGKPDLVVSAGPDGNVWGTPAAPHWRVYKNVGGQFAAAPTMWPVPSARFRYLRDSCAGIIDVDGDRRLDLVDFCELTPTKRPWGHDSGTPHWRVFVNGGSSFAGAAIDWALPSTIPAAEAQVGRLPGTRQSYVHMGAWSAIDVDGDGKLDLLAAAPKTSWRIHRATPTGFAQAGTNWSVPSGGSDPLNDYGFGSLTGNLWAATDLDGDGVLDFIVTGKRTGSARLAFTTASKSTPYWKLHRGSAATGFASAAVQWIVPGAAEYLEDGDSFGSKSSAFDIDGDGKPDLVYFGGRSSVYGAAEGKPHWRVYLGANGLFGRPAPGQSPPSADPGPGVDVSLLHEWLLPPALAAIGKNPLNGRDGAAWATVDIDGDGRLDLVVMADATGALNGLAQGKPAWEVYRGMP